MQESPDVSLPSLAASSQSLEESYAFDIETPEKEVTLDAHRKSKIRAGEVLSDHSMIVSPMNLERIKKQNDHPLAMREPVPILASCHAGLNLTPKQLADVFAFFEDTKSDTEKSDAVKSDTTVVDEDDLFEEIRVASAARVEGEDDDAATTVTSNTAPSSIKSHDVERLEQEMKTLKDMLRIDSNNILKLSRDREAFKALSTQLRKKLIPLGKELQTVKAERDRLKEREAEYLETIRVLKLEVDKMTAVQQKTKPLKREVEQLELENSLLASQIIEYEHEMTRLRESFNATGSDGEVVNCPKPDEHINDSGSIASLEGRIVALEKRLEQVISCDSEENEDDELDPIIAIDANKVTRKQVLPVQALVDTKEESRLDEGSMKGDDHAELDDSEGIEVPLESISSHIKATNSNGQSPSNNQSLETGWLCDCFPFQHSVDKDMS